MSSSTQPDPAPAIRLRDLRFRWAADESELLVFPEYVVGAGERLFVCGQSGSGKSTLLGILAGILTPTSGDLEILGIHTATLDANGRDRFRADHIGYIFQQFNLIPYLSVRENVILGCQFSARRLERAGDAAASADDLLNRLGLGGLGDKLVGELSVGQQQRVAAARSLLGKPEIVLADEPTSALDASSRDRFLDLLMDVCGDSTLVMVSHDGSIANRFDRTLELEAGV